MLPRAAASAAPRQCGCSQRCREHTQPSWLASTDADVTRCTTARICCATPALVAPAAFQLVNWVLYGAERSQLARDWQFAASTALACRRRRHLAARSSALLYCSAAVLHLLHAVAAGWGTQDALFRGRQSQKGPTPAAARIAC